MDDRMNDSVITLLRTTFDVKAAELDVAGDDRAGESVLVPFPRTAVGGGRPRRNMLAVAACFALVAGGAGAVIAFRADAPSGTGAPTTTAPQPSVGTLAEAVAWYLPALVPPGYRLTELSASMPDSDALPDGSEPGADGSTPDGSDGNTDSRWLIRGDDGVTVAGWLNVQAFRIPPSPDSEGLPIGTRDDPQVSTWGTPDFGGWTVEWVENGTSVFIQATEQIDSDALLAIVESSTVTDGAVTIDPASLPVGVVSPDPAEPLPDSQQPTNVSTFMMNPIEGTGGAIWMRAQPYFGSLDAATYEETERREVNGREYSIFIREPDEHGPFAQVAWVDAGNMFWVMGRTGVETVEAVANSVRRVTVAEAAQAADAIDATALALPTVAATTTPSGLDVAVRGGTEGGDTAVVLCVSGADNECVRSTLESALDGSGSDSLYDVFVVDGQRHLVGWQAAEPVGAEPIDGAAPEFTPASTGLGWFLDIPLPGGAAVPTVMFDGNGGQTGVGVTERIHP